LSGHVNCWFLRRLDGSAGALVVNDRTAFLTALRATGRFCEDSSRGSMLHGGHSSFREMATGTSEALHFTAAGGDYLWVHLDRVSPSPDASPDGRCRYRSRQAAAHIRRDVVPLFLRNAGRARLSLVKGPPAGTPSPLTEQRGWLRELC
jgi:hypothetical protein